MKEIIEISLLLIILGFVVDNWRKIGNRRFGGTSRRVLLDTSVLIDGRIVELAKTGFLNDELVIPRSVLGELQLMADGKNSDKRARARHGLDVVSLLQKIEQVTVVILPDNRQTPEGVDSRLLELAKKNDYLLATLDFNLNKVAKVEGVKVLNINELARVIRVKVLLGEQLEITLSQGGQGRDQAVGHLEDGIMVVVPKAKKYIGQKVKVVVDRIIQTDAGKMVFAELLEKTQATPVDERKTNSKTVRRDESRFDSRMTANSPSNDKPDQRPYPTQSNQNQRHLTRLPRSRTKTKNTKTSVRSK